MSNAASPTATSPAQSVRTPARRETTTESATTDTPVRTADLIEADDLVEEVSIDGMCGVY